MSLLNADVVPEQVQKESKREPIRLAIALGMAAVGVAIGIVYFVAPKQATEAVREVVEAARSLVKAGPAPKPAEPQDESKPVKLGHNARVHGAAPGRPTVAAAVISGMEPLMARPSGPPQRLYPSLDLPIGTVKPKVRELFGAPDLALYKLEKDHVVEHFVYVNHAQNYAISVLLVDGRVASVDSGMPSYRGTRSSTGTPPEKRVNN